MAKKGEFDMDRVSEKLDRFAGMLDKLANVAEKIPNLVLAGGVAYAGMTALDNPMGAVVALAGLEMAKSDGLFSNAAGIAILTGIGLANITPKTDVADVGPTDQAGVPNNFRQYYAGRTG